MNPDLLEQTLKVLISVRKELDGSAENGVIQEIDEVIERLEIEKNEPSGITSSEVLIMLDKIFQRLPLVIRLINLFSG